MFRMKRQGSLALQYQVIKNKYKHTLHREEDSYFSKLQTDISWKERLKNCHFLTGI